MVEQVHRADQGRGEPHPAARGIEGASIAFEGDDLTPGGLREGLR